MADLTLPEVGDPGPQWAYEVLDAFNLVNESTENNETAIGTLQGGLSSVQNDINLRMAGVATQSDPDTAPSGWTRAGSGNAGVPGPGNFLVFTAWFNSGSGRAQLALRVVSGGNELWIRNMSGSSWSAWEQVNKPLENRVAGLVEDGGVYPARVSGVTNLFIGSSNPAPVMATGDAWVNTSAITSDEATALVNDPESSLGAAVRAGLRERVTIPIPAFGPGDPRPATMGPWSSSVNTVWSVPAWYFSDSSTQLVSGVFDLPSGWASGRLSLFWGHKTTEAVSTSVRWQVWARPWGEGSALNASGAGQVNMVSSEPAFGGGQTALRTDFNGLFDAPIAAGAQRVQVAIARVGADAADTFVGQVGLVGVEFERMA